ncbi:MAG: alanine/glycine:cation symporter family protein [Mycoplasmatales bacterium]
MEIINNLLNLLSSNPIYIYGIPLAGLVFTIMLGFVQVKYFKVGVKNLFTVGEKNKNKQKEGVSSWKAAALAIGGRVGTGNIAGVTVAILTGGPGAVFWMWVAAFLGMATSFCESTLGQVFKTKNSDHVYVGGPSYYIEHGLGKKWKPLAKLYAIVMIFSFGLFFVSLQTSTILSSVSSTFKIEQSSMGMLIFLILIACGVAYAGFGGMDKLTNLSAIIVPPMTIGYALLVGVIIVINLGEVPRFFQIVFEQAFSVNALISGGIGAAITSGVKRGIFSNEAGQGSGAIAAATAEVDHPAQQGFSQMITVFIDTFIVCTLTAFVIIVSWNVQGFLEPGAISTEQYAGLLSVLDGGGLASSAFDKLLPGASIFLTIFLFFFAFTSILAEIAYGLQSVKYLTEYAAENRKKVALFIYSCATVVMTLATPILDWLATTYPQFNLFSMADNIAALLFYTNIIALVILLPLVKKTLADYQMKSKTGKRLTFKPKDVDLKFKESAWDEE